METWKAIPDFPGYGVSDHGNVRSYYSRKGATEWRITNKARRVLTPGINPQGYRFVNLADGSGTQRTLKIARLVLRAFIGHRPDDENIDICHNDGNRQNDRLDNLRYDTRKGNQADRIGHGTVSLSRRFSETEVITMRTLRAAGMKLKDLGIQYNCRPNRIANACTGRTYIHIGGPLTKKGHR